MALKKQIRDFVTTNFYVADPKALEDSTSLLDHGIIDSTGVLEVIMFVESAFGVTVEDAEMLPENLDSIERIAAFVAAQAGSARRVAKPDASRRTTSTARSAASASIRRYRWRTWLRRMRPQVPRCRATRKAITCVARTARRASP